MTGAHDLARMVPGFEFLEGLMKNAGAAVPSMGQWIAPTLDPEVLDKRIGELRTVQFWLEQNARLLATTIQALEVQRMTLSTLQSMNLPLSELGEALRIKTPTPAPPPPAPAPVAAAPAGPVAAGAARPPVGGIDPMQWWGALTQQFTEIAAKALKEVGVENAAAADPPAAEPAGAPAATQQAPARKRAAAPRKRSG
jgi:hypothetical protein